jgi:hypothetical protein
MCKRNFPNNVAPGKEGETPASGEAMGVLNCPRSSRQIKEQDLSLPALVLDLLSKLGR